MVKSFGDWRYAAALDSIKAQNAITEAGRGMLMDCMWKDLNTALDQSFGNTARMDRKWRIMGRNHWMELN